MPKALKTAQSLVREMSPGSHEAQRAQIPPNVQMQQNGRPR